MTKIGYFTYRSSIGFTDGRFVWYMYTSGSIDKFKRDDWIDGPYEPLNIGDKEKVVPPLRILLIVGDRDFDELERLRLIRDSVQVGRR